MSFVIWPLNQVPFLQRKLGTVTSQTLHYCLLHNFYLKYYFSVLLFTLVGSERPKSVFSFPVALGISLSILSISVMLFLLLKRFCIILSYCDFVMLSHLHFSSSGQSPLTQTTASLKILVQPSLHAGKRIYLSDRPEKNFYLLITYLNIISSKNN